MTWLLTIYLAVCAVLLYLHWRAGWRDLTAVVLCIALWPLLVPWVLLDVIRAVRRLG